MNGKNKSPMHTQAFNTHSHTHTSFISPNFLFKFQLQFQFQLWEEPLQTTLKKIQFPSEPAKVSERNFHCKIATAGASAHAGEAAGARKKITLEKFFGIFQLS
jgi:hypothetical protein